MLIIGNNILFDTFQHHKMITLIDFTNLQNFYFYSQIV